MYYDGEYCMVSRREIAGRILTVQRETGRLKTVFQTACLYGSTSVKTADDTAQRFLPIGCFHTEVSVYFAAIQYAVCGARGRRRILFARNGLQFGGFEAFYIFRGRLKNRLGKFVPAYRFVAAEMVNTACRPGGFQDVDQCLGQITGISRITYLVVNH